jgi:hypothetical protein
MWAKIHLLFVLKKYNNSNIKPMLRFKTNKLLVLFFKFKGYLAILYLGTIGKVDIPFKVILWLFVQDI